MLHYGAPGRHGESNKAPTAAQRPRNKSSHSHDVISAIRPRIKATRLCKIWKALIGKLLSIYSAWRRGQRKYNNSRPRKKTWHACARPQHSWPSRCLNKNTELNQKQAHSTMRTMVPLHSASASHPHPHPFMPSCATPAHRRRSQAHECHTILSHYTVTLYCHTILSHYIIK
jgi:hypothetical protein